MRITFLVPSYPTSPIGGFAVAYELANGLAARGHEVTIVHPRTTFPPRGMIDGLKSMLWPTRVRFRDGRTPRWASISERVRISRLPYLRPAWVPSGDVVVATAWQTAEVATRLPERAGRVRYLVQDFEMWMTADAETKARIAETFAAGFPIAATSGAVELMLAERDVKPAVSIRLGLNPETFRIEAPIFERPRGTLAFPSRRDPLKGTTDAVAAVEILRKRQVGGLRATAFGYWRPSTLPGWVDFLDSPTDRQLRKLLNAVSIFVLPSHFEGFGLPGLEAMACGAALVTTDSVGPRDYAVDGETALVVPRREPESLADAIERLIADDELRTALAMRGALATEGFRWEPALETFEAFLSA